MKRIAYLGAKSIGLECLKILLDRKEKGGYTIDALFTNLGRNVESNMKLIAYAKEHGIEVYDGIDTILDLPEFDLIVSIQYHEILRAKHLARAKQIAVNLHMAPLPEYRGCNQYSYAIIEGRKEFGCTLHQIDEGVDTGDIMFESRFPIPENCYVNELVDLTYEKAIKLFDEKILDIVNGNYTLTPQSTLVPLKGTKTIYRKDINKLKVIDLGWEKDKIEAYLRATMMPGFEPPYALVNDQKVYFTSK